MVWVKLDDDLPLQRRHQRLSDSANWCLYALIAFSNREGTDGAVARDDLTLVRPGVPEAAVLKQLAELEAAGAVKPTATGWRVLWLIDDQPSAEEIEARAEAKRAADRVRQQRKRAADRERQSRSVTRDVARESRLPAPAPAPAPGSDPESLERVEDLDPPDPRARVGEDSRLVFDSDSEQTEARATALLERFERVVHAGKRVGDRDRCLKLLGDLLPALDDRAPDEPEALFERVLTRYTADRRAGSRTPTVELFVRDFAQWAERGSSAPARSNHVNREADEQMRRDLAADDARYTARRTPEAE